MLYIEAYAFTNLWCQEAELAFREAVEGEFASLLRARSMKRYLE